MSKLRCTSVRGRLIAWTFFVLGSLTVAGWGIAELDVRTRQQQIFHCLVVDGVTVYRGLKPVRSRIESGGYLTWWTSSGQSGGSLRADKVMRFTVSHNRTCRMETNKFMEEISVRDLLEENARLREALEPFGDPELLMPENLPSGKYVPEYKELPCVWLYTGKPNGGDFGHLQVEDFRRARKALEEK